MSDQVAELGFVFPGQGSQAIGMLDSLAAEFPAIVGAALEEASDALGYSLGGLIDGSADAAEARLAQTEFTQPAILTTSVICWRIFEQLTPLRPAMLAGHSLGEYSALVCAGSLPLADAAALVRDRGALMQRAVPEGEGGMAAVLGLDDAEVERCCAGVEGSVAAANYNAPGQVVIAGSKASVEAAIEACKAAGAKRAVPVAMSVPSHSVLLKDAAALLADRLASVELQTPSIPIVHNVDASLAGDADSLRAKLAAQLHNPVRWTDCMARLGEQGITLLAECGPGKVLSGLQRRINKVTRTAALGSPVALREFVSALAAEAST